MHNAMQFPALITHRQNGHVQQTSGQGPGGAGESDVRGDAEGLLGRPEQRAKSVWLAHGLNTVFVAENYLVNQV